MASTYTLISSNTLSSSAASVTFSSIPSTYTDLVLRVSARSDNGGSSYDYCNLVFNSDTAANYSETWIRGNGSTAASSRSTGDIALFGIFAADGNTATANTFGNTEFYIPNYTSTANRPVGQFGVTETNATAALMAAQAALYRGTSAISRIDIQPYAGTNWLTGSSFYLYGIKNS